MRTISNLSQNVYDLVVIGGGIYGASVARDAALRGFSVALLEQGDFGNATSANNHKIIHGGLRYLQHADFKRMRESIRERSILMRIAPHLVSPLPFLVPTYKRLLQGKLLMSVALRLNDLISFDRNQGLDPQKRIPRSRIVSATECLQLCPSLDHADLTGGALFFDGQVHNPDRLNLSVLLSAAQAGAALANYTQVNGFLRGGDAIRGVEAIDVLTKRSFTVQARIVVNCSGPWSDHVLQFLGSQKQRTSRKLLKAAVLVTRPLARGVAVGIPGRARYKDRDAVLNKGHRFFFITPWRDTSLIGTFQALYEGDPDYCEVTEVDIQSFLSEVNGALPEAGLTTQDVRFVYRGLLPRAHTNDKSGDAQLAKHYEISDHAAEDGADGLISVMGVKYTTARSVAEEAVDLAAKKLGRKMAKCRTAVTPVHGGAIGCLEQFAAQALEKRPTGISVETLQHLIRTYGSEYPAVLKYCEEDAEWGQLVTDDAPVIKAEILHGVRAEMAQRLSDVVLRRTELGTAGHPGEACLITCAMICARELGWDKKRALREIEEAEMIFHRGCL